MVDLKMLIAEAYFILGYVLKQHWADLPAEMHPDDCLMVVGWFERTYPTEYLQQRTLYRLGGRRDAPVR